MAETRRRGKKYPRKSGGSPANPCKIFVGNISYKITQGELEEFFQEFGPVQYCQIVKDHRKGWSRGIAFVTFKNVESAERALAAPEESLILDGRVVRVARPTTKKRLLAMQEAMATDGSGGDEQGEVCRDTDELSTYHLNGQALTSCQESTAVSSTNTADDVPQLNDDILLHVVSYLDMKSRIVLERVCKRWCRVARASWQYVKELSFKNVFMSFRGKYGGLSDEIFHSVLKRGCRNLVSLDLSSTPQFLTDFGIDLIGMYCRKLEKLDLSSVSVTQASFKQLSQRCSNLRWLKMSGCHAVGEKCVWWALHNCKELQYINLNDNRRVNGQCFFMAGDTLRHVYLHHCDKLTDSGLLLLLSRSSKLETLDISHCPLLTGTTLQNVTKHCAGIKNLQFAGPNENVTLSDMSTIGRLQELEVLNVDQQSAFGDQTLQILGSECWNLRCLSCAACYSISDAGITCLASCHQLSDLNISYCHQVTDEGLAKVIQHCMRRLVMRACQGISDSTVSLIAQTCLRLEELDVCGCLAVTNTSLYALQESLLHMRYPDCPSFTLLAGGSSVGSDAVLKFAAATGATVSLHDLSTPSLSADYDPYLYIPPLNATEETENWEEEEQAPSFTIQPQSYLSAEAKVDQSDDFLLERAEDFLTADDPALYSDEFSEPEEWGMT